ncbi:MAG: DUF362 domain-containing protein [Armatimonadetes bacterium]|nr:DUF362 domain-containing protein [Armatimonadota bacterium]
MSSPVAIVKTSPETVLEDYGRVMRLAGYDVALPRERDTILKLNLSWTLFYPACSSPPWQLDGVLTTMLADGYERKSLLPVENKTVVTDPWKGARNNGWLGTLEREKIPFTDLPSVEWMNYRFDSDLLVLNRIFPEGIQIPRMFVGRNVLHMPTIKTHGHSVTTGAIKNSFGGLLREVRHYCHEFIHETLVDLLLMQNEIHPGIFAVMDGAVCGDGAGPRTMVPRIKNVLLASADQVAIDSVAAGLMGFEPMSIPYLRMAQERGLGCAELKRIELVGDTELAGQNWGFKTRRSFVIWGDQMIRKGPLRPLKRLLLHSPLMGWAPAASNLYHDYYWYPRKGSKYVREFMESDWGRLFQRYTQGTTA